MDPYGDDELRDYAEEEYNNQLMHGGDEFPKFMVQVVVNVSVFASCGADAVEMAWQDLNSAVVMLKSDAAREQGVYQKCYGYDVTNGKVISKS